jgi:hypothetical protein
MARIGFPQAAGKNSSVTAGAWVRAVGNGSAGQLFLGEAAIVGRLSRW